MVDVCFLNGVYYFHLISFSRWHVCRFEFYLDDFVLLMLFVFNDMMLASTVVIYHIIGLLNHLCFTMVSSVCQSNLSFSATWLVDVICFPLCEITHCKCSSLSLNAVRST